MNWTRRLGLGALALGAAAPFAGSPYRSAAARLDVDGLVRLIATGEDHVSALQLAEWIRARKPGLRVVDVRTPAEFAAYSIPTAENLPIEKIANARFSPSDTVVLYSEGGAHAGQAWVLLRALGVNRVFFIAGGLVDWDLEVMQPTVTAESYPMRVELSRYFGGEPRIGAAPEAVRTPTPRRRGC